MDPEKPLFDTICTLPLSSDLFAQAIHPTEPLLAVGLASGHVETFRLPAVPGDGSNGNGNDDDDEGETTLTSENGIGQIETVWRTRRHKGSCRSLGYGLDGQALYSTGTDGLVKCANTETGRVTAKIAVPNVASTGESDLPTLLHVLSPQTFLLGTDSAALHLYDLRVADHTFAASKPQQSHHPHEDYISSLTPLAPTEASTSGFSKQWVSTGGTTLAVTDLRRGVLVRSEDQEEELLSSIYVGGLRRKGSSMGQKVLVGGAGGVITLWERGQWDDQDERIIVDRTTGGGESLDTLTLLPEGVGPGGKIVAAGMGNGTIRLVHLGPNRVIGELSHDDAEGVVELGFDVGGRMISGGGQNIKVWYEAVEGSGDNDDDDEDDDDGDDASKRKTADSSDEEDDSDDDSSEDERSSKRKKKKRRKGKISQLNGGKFMDFKGLD